MGQDWSEVWLQQFSGTITVWPRGRITDFIRILSDPSMERLAYMLKVGQQSAFPKLVYLGNRMKVERAVEQGRIATRTNVRRGSIESIISEADLEKLIREHQGHEGDDTTGAESGEEGGDWRRPKDDAIEWRKEDIGGLDGVFEKKRYFEEPEGLELDDGEDGDEVDDDELEEDEVWHSDIEMEREEREMMRNRKVGGREQDVAAEASMVE